MSAIFDTGFIVWGYLLLYVLLTVAYFLWSAGRARREDATQPVRTAVRPNEGDPR